MEMVRTEDEPPRPSRRGGRDDRVGEADAVLMQHIATADRTAMLVLFSRYHLAVYRFVLQRVQDTALAEDLTSEVFLDVWHHADCFEGRCAVLTWILAIARHKTFAACPRPRPQFDGNGGSGGENTDAPDEPLQASDRPTVLRRCIARLSAEHREVIDLVYYQEQSMESVATILGVPRSTAKTCVSYARKRLADELKKTDVEWVAT